MKNRFNLNLPNTKFPMKANLAINELITLKKWENDNLYQKILDSKKEKKFFILHDGPPYANGNIHLGHAFNKILKDIIIKSKNMNGYSTPFIPGWDCHGLPIEQKVEQNLNILNKKISQSKLRLECRKYALKQIKKQKKDFIRLGVLADWENPYLTMDFKTEANIIRTFSKILQNNHIYKGEKPVHWCTSCCSSLAEAEVDYVNKKSLSLYVKFKIINIDFLKSFYNIKNDFNISLLIWTTTPWTIPANKAVAIHPNIKYQLIKINNEIIIIAKKLVKKIMQKSKILEWNILGEIKGSFFKNIFLYHPMNNNSTPLIITNYISENSGTGIVHIAPNYGLDDYNICIKNNIKGINIINKKGFFMKGIHPNLDYINIFNSDKIIQLILIKKKSLFLSENYLHSYPYCWRHKIPVIFKATPQWFIGMDKNKLRDLTLKTMKKVVWMPNWGFNRMHTMLINRPDWCISRQRFWGVPIPLFIHKKTQKIHHDSINLIESIAKIIEKKGIQSWWDLDITNFLGTDAINYEKVLDVLDVWFDSGSTYYSVISNIKYLNKEKIDVYLEGSDQYRGWFISSLIISTSIENKAPYKTVISHGFTVDNQGKKMSKSLGNIIHPQKIINLLGSDILRLWVSLTDYSNDICISENILNKTTEIYRRIRNTARFLLSNLDEFIPEKNMLQETNMLILDRWIINKTKLTQNYIINNYNNYNIQNVIKKIVKFCSIDMGSFYLEIIKDRLYTFKKNSIARLSSQTALYLIIESLVRWITPILSFTADEIWNYIPGKRSKYVFTEEWYSGLFELSSYEKMNNNYWENLFKVKIEINKIIENAREKNIIGSSLEANIILYLNTNIYNKLLLLGNELKFFLLVSSVTIIEYKNNCNNKLISKFKITKVIGKKCLRCWYYYIKLTNNICNRCIQNVEGTGEIRFFV
ncbi:isoleucine--tRNA ligase [Enterobacteriaceae endosymbiont of Plateumaris consimilis]|uniref:isoleucine--tRNA ligase n=1 Tax=Enterobacteriaceae endosymbiont of Plateumaris consimilis TaxID=2675794 RepID=UPI001449BD3C|nr:isoleucine--tRNA ligase [Enterobacteriaceae endosymbiont of Plateumaris consimilis]QJC28481.1 isoleucine--tRNA ligase [Enterobacteriaceae endosymbiont of Plateumaris consimilis]